MEQKSGHRRLGVFVLATMLIIVAILFVLGGRSLFQPTFTFETYFNESVAGLNIGAPVSFRGVPLGQVTEIVSSGAIYEKGVPIEKRKNYIVVRAKVGPSRDQVRQYTQEAPEMVKLGLRAKTQIAGITGQQYLALDFMDPVKFPAAAISFDWTPEWTYVPSAPTLTSQIVANAQSFMANLNEADIKALVRDLNTLVVDIDRNINTIPFAELAARADDVLKHADTTIKRIDGIVAGAPIEKSLDNLAAFTESLREVAEGDELKRVVKGLDELAVRLDGVVGDNQYDLRVIVQDLRVTADNLRTLSDTIKRYPAGALVGGPPDKVQIPGSAK